MENVRLGFPVSANAGDRRYPAIVVDDVTHAVSQHLSAESIVLVDGALADRSWRECTGVRASALDDEWMRARSASPGHDDATYNTSGGGSVSTT